MRLLLADDHPLFLEAVVLQIERSLPGAEILTARSLDEALETGAGALPLDIALLDLSMPGMNGLEGIVRVKAALGGCPVAIMSGIARPHEALGSILAGARGFLPKTMPGAAFASALQVVIAGGTYVPAELLAGGIPSVGPAASSGPGTVPGDPSLTPRELDVLKGLVEGCSNKEIGRHLDVQEVTVKLHVRRILQKLGARNRAEAAALAVERRLLTP